MFKTQLVNIEKDKMIPDKNNQGKFLNFDVLTFLEINKQTNIPTGKVRDKWYNPTVVNDFSKYLHKLNLKVGNYYNLVLDLSGTIVDITELIPSKFETVRKIANMATGGCLISSGVAVGINNDFMNAYAVPTIVAGASKIIHNLLPMETNHNVEEMQETTFTSENARLINDVLERTQPVYRATTYNCL